LLTRSVRGDHQSSGGGWQGVAALIKIVGALRNSKLEIRNSKQIRNSKFEETTAVMGAAILSLELESPYVVSYNRDCDALICITGDDLLWTGSLWGRSVAEYCDYLH
jgi:hypothetical protein